MTEKYITANSSLGYVYFHPETGNAILDCHNGNELDEIDRFDVVEYKKFYNVTEIPTFLDILDIGYWLKSSFYEAPCEDWRKEVALLRAGVDPNDLPNEIAFLCKCTNCDSRLFDENPQTDAEKRIITGVEKHMVQCGEGESTFWACPKCLTDDYLIDL